MKKHILLSSILLAMSVLSGCSTSSDEKSSHDHSSHDHSEESSEHDHSSHDHSHDSNESSSEAHQHSFQHHDAKAATCTEDGNYEYYTCTGCSSYFDSDHEEITDPSRQLVIPKLNHDYDTPTYTWKDDYSSVTAKAICKNDSTHILVEVVTPSYVSNGEPTCTDEGELLYTATFTNAKFAQQTKARPVSEIGHNYGAPTYVWNTDNTEVTASRICSNNPLHIETETVGVDAEITKHAKCGVMGETTYTSHVFTNTAFTVQSKIVEDVAALEHEYGAWQVTTPATCTEDGEETRYCIHDHTHTETRPVSALSHVYAAPTKSNITWDIDNQECTVRAYCKNDTSHVYERTVDAIPVVNEPTCTAPGKTTLTATFDDLIIGGVPYSTSTIQIIPALTHDFHLSYVWNYTDADNVTLTATATCNRLGCGEEISHTYDATLSTDTEKTYAPTYDNDGRNTYYVSDFGEYSSIFSYQEKGYDVDQLLRVYEDPTYEIIVEDEVEKIKGTKVCNDPTATIEEIVAVASITHSQAPTCTNDGLDVYTSAVFTNPAFGGTAHNVEKVVPALGHSFTIYDGFDWDEENHTAEAIYRCSRSGCTETTSHEANVVKGDAVAPTCQEDGYTPYTATYIESESPLVKRTDVRNLDVVEHDPDDHNLTDWAVSTPATCTSKGEEERHCQNSGCTYHEERAIEMTPHNYSKFLGFIWDDEHQSAQAKYECADCGATHLYDANVEQGAKVSDADCIHATKYTFTATFSDDDHTLVTENRNIEIGNPNGHNYAHIGFSWEADGSAVTASEKCSVCDHVKEHDLTDDIQDDIVGTLSCTSDEVHRYSVSYTDGQNKLIEDHIDVKTRDAASAHTPKEAAQENVVPATCVDKGSYDLVVRCSICDQILSSTHHEIPATGIHTAGDPVRENEVAATCTVNGSYDEVTYCTVCGEELSRTPKVIVASHDYAETVVPPTCTAQGYTRHTCSKCNDTYQDNEVAALGHDYNNVVTPATCTEKGYTTHTCSRCNDVVVDSYTDALGHTNAAPVKENVSEGDCVSGTEYDSVVYCSVCHAEVSRNHVVEEPKAHTFGDWTVTKEASCSEAGSKYRTCSECGYQEVVVIAKLQHSYTNVTVIPATCTTQGYTTHTCTLCGDSYNDTYVAAKGHAWNIEAPTCTEAQVCSVCGEENGALGHDYHRTGITEATCTTSAIEHLECSLCGDTYDNTDYSPALGHKYEYSEVLKSGSTCIYDKVYTCSICGDSYKDGTVEHHSFISSIQKNPTCKETGVRQYICEHCAEGNFYYTEIIPVDTINGHEWIEGTPVDGKRTDTCNLCGQERVVVLDNSTSINEVSSTNAEVNLNNGSLILTDEDGNLPENVEGKDISVGIDILGKDDEGIQALSEEQKAIIGDEPVYNFSMSDGDNQITDLGGYITVTLPYELSAGEDPNNIVIYYYNENGSIEIIRATYLNGYVTFKTNHFSYYQIAKLTPEEQCEKFGHEYGEWVIEVEPNCDHSGSKTRTCSRCGYVEVEEIPSTISHNYVELVDSYVAPTCTTSGIRIYECSNCHKQYREIVASLGHAYVLNEELSRDADCENNGVITYICSNCGGTKTTILPALEHDYQVEVVAPTCEEDGYTIHSCSRCDSVYYSDYTSATGHHFGEYQTIREANCEHTGIKTRYCSDCDLSETIYVAATSHTPGEKEILEGEAANCLHDGYHYEVIRCTVCNKTLSKTRVTDPMTEHDYGDFVTTLKPTCTERGIETKTCSVCGHEVTRTIAATGHTPGNATKENIVEATCESSGSYNLVVRCSTCNELLSSKHVDVPALGHKWGNYVVDPDHPATCTTRGIEVRECSVCHEKETRYTAFAAHTPGEEENINVIESTCDKTGSYDQVIRCSECGQVISLVNHVTTPATGHNYGDWIIDSEATCVLAGSKHHVCSNDENHIEYEVIPATGHTPLEAVKQNEVAAKCGIAGYYDSVVYCETCHAELSRERIVVEALTHSYSDWETVTAPTCSSTGLQRRTCSLCDNYQQRIIAKTAHTPLEAVKENEVAATCLAEGGYDEVIRCSECSSVISSTHTTLPALGHDYVVDFEFFEGNYESANVHITCSRCEYEDFRVVNLTFKEDYVLSCEAPQDVTYVASYTLEGVTYTDELVRENYQLAHVVSSEQKENVTEATCTEAGGYDSVYYCTVCNKELLRTHTSTPALGHNLSDWELVTEPTCTSDGLKERHCLREGCDYVEELAIAKLGHTPGTPVLDEESIVSPSCGQDGGYDLVIYCTVCGEELERNHYTEEAANHIFGTWQLTKVPTCTEKGEQTRTCARCGKTETREVAATGHVEGRPVKENIVDPTCTEYGSYDLVTYCTVCGEILNKETIDVEPTGHTIGEIEKLEGKDPTCTEAGYYVEVTYCSVCGEEMSRENVEIPATGHHYGGYEWNDYEHYRRCYICGEKTSVESHSITSTIEQEATCTKTGTRIDKCVCGYTHYVNIPMTAHQYNDDGICIVCGASKPNEVCPHLNVEIRSFDASEWGTCGFTCTYRHCNDCGLDFIDIYQDEFNQPACDMSHPGESGQTVINGKTYYYQSQICPKCGTEYLSYQSQEDTVVDGCTVRRTAYMKIVGPEGQELTLAEVMESTNHQYEKQVQTIGDGLLTVYYEECSVCHDVRDLQNRYAEGLEPTRNSTDPVVNEDGSYSYQVTETLGNIRVVASVSGVRMYKAVPCYYLETSTYTYYVNDELVFTKSYNKQQSNHTFEEQEPTFNDPELGCIGGVHYEKVCPSCGSSQGSTTYSHTSSNPRRFTVKDANNYDYVIITYDTCSICHKDYVDIKRAFMYDDEWLKKADYKETIDGVEYSGYIFTPIDDKADVTVYVLNGVKYKNNESCEGAKFVYIKVVRGEESLFFLNEAINRGEYHNYVEEYHFEDEDIGCYGGFTYSSHCSRCGELIKEGEGTWHNYDEKEQRNSYQDNAGQVVFEVTSRECSNCGLTDYFDVSYNDENVIVSDEGRKLTSKDGSISITRSPETRIEKSECLYYITYTITVTKNGVVVDEYRRVERNEKHNRVFDHYELKGKSCEFGYEEVYICSNCGDIARYFNRQHIIRDGECLICHARDVVDNETATVRIVVNSKVSSIIEQYDMYLVSNNSDEYRVYMKVTNLEAATYYINENYYNLVLFIKGSDCSNPNNQVYSAYLESYRLDQSGSVIYINEIDTVNRQLYINIYDENNCYHIYGSDVNYVFENIEIGCRAGYYVEATCPICGKDLGGDKRYWHDFGGDPKLDHYLDGNGNEVLVVEYNNCNVCGQIAYFDVRSEYAYDLYNGETSSYEDTDGVYHNISTKLIGSSNVTFIVDNYTRTMGCYNVHYIRYIVLDKDGAQHSYLTVDYINPMHHTTASYSLIDEELGCEGGVKVTVTCDVCHKVVEEYTRPGHITGYFKEEYKDNSGNVIGHVETEECLVCHGEAKYINYNFYNSNSSSSNPSSKTINGQLYEGEMTTYQYDGFIIVVESLSYFKNGIEEKCLVEEGHYVCITRINEDSTSQILKAVSYKTQHYDHKATDESLTIKKDEDFEDCNNNGYQIVRYCEDCGEEISDGYYYNHRYDVNGRCKICGAYQSGSVGESLFRLDLGALKDSSYEIYVVYDAYYDGVGWAYSDRLISKDSDYILVPSTEGELYFVLYSDIETILKDPLYKNALATSNHFNLSSFYDVEKQYLSFTSFSEDNKEMNFELKYVAEPTYTITFINDYKAAQLVINDNGVTKEYISNDVTYYDDIHYVCTKPFVRTYHVEFVIDGKTYPGNEIVNMKGYDHTFNGNYKILNEKQHAKQCSECGSLYDYESHYEFDDGYCICGYSLAECTHDNTYWNLTLNDPSIGCEAGGIRREICSYCGIVVNEYEYETLGHDHINNEYVAHDNEGNYLFSFSYEYCSICNKTFNVELRANSSILNNSESSYEKDGHSYTVEIFTSQDGTNRFEWAYYSDVIDACYTVDHNFITIYKGDNAIIYLRDYEQDIFDHQGEVEVTYASNDPERYGCEVGYTIVKTYSCCGREDYQYGNGHLSLGKVQKVIKDNEGKVIFTYEEESCYFCNQIMEYNVLYDGEYSTTDTKMTINGIEYEGKLYVTPDGVKTFTGQHLEELIGHKDAAQGYFVDYIEYNDEYVLFRAYGKLVKLDYEPSEYYTPEDSNELFNKVYGGFVGSLDDAKNASTKNDKIVQYAKAEAELLNTATVLPFSKNNGVKFTRVAPHTACQAIVGNSDSIYKNLVMIEPTEDKPFITACDYEALEALYESQGSNYDPITYLTNHGYTLATEMVLSNDSYSRYNYFLYRSNADVVMNVVEGLYRYDENGTIVPALANGYPVVSNDGLTMTITLRDNIYWYTNEGEVFAPVTADDFVYAYQVMLDYADGFEYLFEPIINTNEYLNRETTFDKVGYKALDDKTIEITFKEPVEGFISSFAYTVALPVNRNYFDSLGGLDGDFGTSITRILSNSAYLLSGNDEEPILVKNPSYYDANNVRLETIRFSNDDQYDLITLYNRVLNDNYASIGLSGSTLDTLNLGEDFINNYLVYNMPSNVVMYLTFNINRAGFEYSSISEEQKIITHKAMSNINFRKALMHAFNRTAIEGLSAYNEESYLHQLVNTISYDRYGALSENVTFDGHTFEAGTTYTDIVAYYYNLWNDTSLDLSSGQDGWYNETLAKAYLAKAKQELGDEFALVTLDYVYYGGSSAQAASAHAYKEVMETVLGRDNVYVNLIPVDSSSDYYYAGRYADNINYELFDSLGWGPDYDTFTEYLAIFINGNMTHYIFSSYDAHNSGSDYPDDPEPIVRENSFHLAGGVTGWEAIEGNMMYATSIDEIQKIDKGVADKLSGLENYSFYKYYLNIPEENVEWQTWYNGINGKYAFKAINAYYDTDEGRYYYNYWVSDSFDGQFGNRVNPLTSNIAIDSNNMRENPVITDGGNQYLIVLASPNNYLNYNNHINEFYFAAINLKSSSGDEGGASGDSSGSTEPVNPEDPTPIDPEANNNIVDVYILNGDSSVGWWNDSSAVTYAYAWDGEAEKATNQIFLDTSYVAYYHASEDSNGSMYFTVNFGEEELREHILLMRCDPKEVEKLPSSWPRSGVWNQTTNGNILVDNVNVATGNYYVNVYVS